MYYTYTLHGHFTISNHLNIFLNCLSVFIHIYETVPKIWHESTKYFLILHTLLFYFVPVLKSKPEMASVWCTSGNLRFSILDKFCPVGSLWAASLLSALVIPFLCLYATVLWVSSAPEICSYIDLSAWDGGWSGPWFSNVLFTDCNFNILNLI